MTWRYKPVGGRFFAGGTTRVVDAMGNGLATSNAAEFQQKRVALGFAADVNALSQAQKDALRQQFSLSYTFDPDGYITEVTDQQGFKTTYTYGGKTAGDPQSAVNQDNLLSVTDRNGWGATNSDSAYFRALRKDLGFVDAGRQRQAGGQPDRGGERPRCWPSSPPPSPTTPAATCSPHRRAGQPDQLHLHRLQQGRQRDLGHGQCAGHCSDEAHTISRSARSWAFAAWVASADAGAEDRAASPVHHHLQPTTRSRT